MTTGNTAVCDVCPCCEASDWVEMFGGDESFKLFVCTDCGCGRIMRTEAEAAGLYDDYYRLESAKRLTGIFDVLWRWKRRRRAARILRHAPRGARVCDVGCERGELLDVLKRSGCRVVGTQVSRAAAEYARRHFGIEVFVGELMDAPFAAERVDVVLMLNVLEHLPDPVRYVRQVAHMTAPGAAYWVEVPNSRSFTARLAGKHWLHHDPDHHLWAFDISCLTRLLERHGFAVERIYGQSWEFGPIGCLQSWLNRLSSSRNVVFNVVRRGFSGHPRLLAQEIAQVLVAACLLPIAAVVALVEGLSGNGQVVVVRARRCNEAVQLDPVAHRHAGSLSA